MANKSIVSTLFKIACIVGIMYLIWYYFKYTCEVHNKLGLCPAVGCGLLKAGETCCLTTDCKGTCCVAGGGSAPSNGAKGKCYDTQGDENGDYKSCLNAGTHWCPHQTDKPSCEQPIGGNCSLASDCIGWGTGIGGTGTVCCNGKCEVGEERTPGVFYCKNE